MTTEESTNDRKISPRKGSNSTPEKVNESSLAWVDLEGQAHNAKVANVADLNDVINTELWPVRKAKLEDVLHEPIILCEVRYMTSGDYGPWFLGLFNDPNYPLKEDEDESNAYFTVPLSGQAAMQKVRRLAALDKDGEPIANRQVSLPIRVKLFKIKGSKPNPYMDLRGWDSTHETVENSVL